MHLSDIYGRSEVKLDEDGAALTMTHVFSEESFLAGHFPGNPIVPGVILIDGMIYATLLLAGKAGSLVGVGPVHINGVTFHAAVRPGKQVVFKAKTKDVNKEITSISSACQVFVDGKRHARGNFTVSLYK